ncbi:hypothetical protein DFH09DRAFT_1473600 [Mycena vulgaris]|nr:hypothetical protein DFH09DRAFT_1473600 [Mycena vulgaris]
MGGFVSQIGHPIATFEQLGDPVLGPAYLSAICKVKVADITARSKGDTLSKGVALTQGLWFITQSLARIHQHLPVTELEVATLAFAIVNVFIWGIWWKKPLDVEQPIRIGPAESSNPGPAPPLIHFGWVDRFTGAVTGDYPEDYNPMLSTSVPSFWSMESTFNDGTPRALLVECFIGSIFGAIHCAAWNTNFPSTDEMWMWKVSSLMVTANPSVLAALFILVWATDNDVLYIISSTFFALVLTPTYIIACLFLIILPFTTLRALPPGAFTDVNWSVGVVSPDVLSGAARGIPQCRDAGMKQGRICLQHAQTAD